MAQITVSVMDTALMRDVVELLGRVHSHLVWHGDQSDEGSETSRGLAEEIAELALQDPPPVRPLPPA